MRRPHRRYWQGSREAGGLLRRARQLVHSCIPHHSGIQVNDFPSRRHIREQRAGREPVAEKPLGCGAAIDPGRTVQAGSQHDRFVDAHALLVLALLGGEDRIARSADAVEQPGSVRAQREVLDVSRVMHHLNGTCTVAGGAPNRYAAIDSGTVVEPAPILGPYRGRRHDQSGDEFADRLPALADP